MTDDHEQSTMELATRARQGDLTAFELLVAQSQDRLSRQIRSRLGPRVGSLMEVDDVYQETVSRALRAIEKARPGSLRVRDSRRSSARRRTRS